MTRLLPSPIDVCECGDYRDNHTGPENRGRCMVCANSHAPWDTCQKFRFFRHATEGEKTAWKALTAPFEKL